MFVINANGTAPTIFTSIKFIAIERKAIKYNFCLDVTYSNSVPVSLERIFCNGTGHCYKKINGTVSVIYTGTNTVIATFDVGQFPMGIAVTQDGKKVYVTNSETSDVSVLDTATNTVITTVPVGRTPTHIARGNDPQPTLII